MIGLYWRAPAGCVIACIKIVVHATDTSAARIRVVIAAVGSITESCAGASNGAARSLAALLPALALLSLASALLLPPLTSLSIAGE